MPWRPLRRIVFGLAIHPFIPTCPDDLPLQVGDEVYIIEQGGVSGEWYRGYLVAPPSLLAGLTEQRGPKRGQNTALEARVYSGIFPSCCVQLKEVLGTPDPQNHDESENWDVHELTKWPGEDQIPFRHPHDPPPVAPVPLLKIGDETAGAARGRGREGSVIDEVAACIREWHSTRLYRHVLRREYEEVASLSGRIARMDGVRRQLLRGVLTRREREQISEGVLGEIRQGGGVVRFSGEVEVEGGEVELVRKAAEWESKSFQADSKKKDAPPRSGALTTIAALAASSKLDEKAWAELIRPTEPELDDGGDPLDQHSLRHLLVDVSGTIERLMAGSGKPEIPPVVLSFYLATAADKRGGLEQITEGHSIDLNALIKNGKVSESNLRILFSGLTMNDLPEGNNLNLAEQATLSRRTYIVVKAFANEPAQEVKDNVQSAAAPSEAKDAGGVSSVMGSIKGGRRSLMWGRRHASTPSQTSQSRPDTGDSHASIPQKRDTKTVRRLVAAGTLYLPPTGLKGNVSVNVSLFQPWSSTPEDGADQQGWDPLFLPSILPSRTGKYKRMASAPVVKLTLNRFVHNDVSRLITEKPTVLSRVSLSRRMGTPAISPLSNLTQKADTKTDIFLRIGGVRQVRNIMLAHPRLGAIQAPPSATGRNLQLTLEVRRESGSRVESCIYHSSNTVPCTAWRTNAVTGLAPWDISIRVSLSPIDIRNAHIVMSIADAPGFPFALGWLPLWTEDAALPNGGHDLILYAYDESTSSMAGGRGAYLSLPWEKQQALKSGFNVDNHPGADLASLWISTTLSKCKDIVTSKPVQDILDISTIFESLSRSTISQLLTALQLAPVDVVVPAHMGILDRLLWLADQDVPDSNFSLVEYHDHLLDAFSFVCAFVNDRRFNLAKQLDAWLGVRPAASPKATVVLLTALQRALSRVVDDSIDLQAGRRVRERVKPAVWLLRILLGRNSPAPDAVRNSISYLFSTIRQLLRLPAEGAAVLTQTMLMQQISSWLSAVSLVLSPRELWMLSRSVIDSCSSAHGILAVWRLVLIRQVVKMALKPENDHVTDEFVSTVVGWVNDCWGDRGLLLASSRHSVAKKSQKHSSSATALNGHFEAQVRLCASIIADLSGRLTSAADVLPGLAESYCLLEPLGSFQAPSAGRRADDFDGAEVDDFKDLHSTDPDSPLDMNPTVDEKNWQPTMLYPDPYPFPIPVEVSSPSSALPELGGLLAKLSSQRLPFGKFENEVNTDLADTLFKTMRMLSSLLASRGCPSSWLSVRAMFCRAASMILNSIHHILSSAYLPSPEHATEFPTDLWRQLLETILQLGASDLLSLEVSPEQQRRAIWQIAGDVRAHTADLLTVAWDSLGWIAPTNYSRFGIRTLGGFQVQYVPSLVGPVAILAVYAHTKLRQSAIAVLRSMVLSEWALSADLSAVEAALADGLATAVSQGGDRIAPCGLVISDLRDAFMGLIERNDDLADAIVHLVSLVQELLSLLSAVHAADEAAVPGALRLLELARILRRDSLFIRYTHRLARLHCLAGHYAEAGLALRLHADLYAWDSTPVPELDVPRLPAEMSMIRKERLYRAAIGLFERAGSWRCALETYTELAAQYELTMFDFSKLARAQRAVAAIHEALAGGRRAAPRFFRVAFRGLGWTTELRNRQYIFEAEPDERAAGVATKLQTQYPSCTVVGSDARASDGEGQFLVLAPVSIHRDISVPVFLKPRVSPAVREFISVGNPRQFSVSVRRAGVVVAKLVFVTAESFPTILRRSEIVDVRTEQVSAIGHAVETVTRRTAELSITLRRATGDTMVGAGEVPIARPEAPNLLLSRIGRLLDPSDELSCVSIRELLRLPSPIMEGNSDSNPHSPHIVDDSIHTGAAVSPSQSVDLRPALRTVLLDHVILIRKAIQTLASLPTPIPTETRRKMLEQFSQVWAPELAALETIGSSADHNDESVVGEDMERAASPNAEGDNGDGMKNLTEIMNRLTTTGSENQPNERQLPAQDARSSRSAAKRLSLAFLKRRGSAAISINGNSPSTPNGGRSNPLSSLRPGIANRRSGRLSTSTTGSAKRSGSSPVAPQAVAKRGGQPTRLSQYQTVPSAGTEQAQATTAHVSASAIGSSGLDIDMDLDLALALDLTEAAQLRHSTSMAQQKQMIDHATELQLPSLAELPAENWR